jgi:hypothetical protein
MRYGIGTMTNDLDKAEEIFADTDYRMLNILGIASTIQHSVDLDYSISQPSKL